MSTKIVLKEFSSFRTFDVQMKQVVRGVRVMVFKATFNNISVKYHGGQFYCWRKPKYPEKTSDLPQVTFS